jgi:hypothetical protein
VRVGREHTSRRRAYRPRRGVPVAVHMRAFSHAITAAKSCPTPASCPCPPPFPTARASPSLSSAPPGLGNHGRSAPLEAFHVQPTTRAMARCKLVKALAAAGLLTLSVYTELVFDEGKGALVRAALVGPAVRRRASALRICQLTTPARSPPPPCPPSSPSCRPPRAYTSKHARPPLSSRSPCTVWIHAEAPCSGRRSRCAPPRASACRCSGRASTFRRTLRCVACCVLYVLAERAHAESAGRGQSRAGEYISPAFSCSYPFPRAGADHASQT